MNIDSALIISLKEIIVKCEHATIFTDNILVSECNGTRNYSLRAFLSATSCIETRIDSSNAFHISFLCALIIILSFIQEICRC